MCRSPSSSPPSSRRTGWPAPAVLRTPDVRVHDLRHTFAVHAIQSVLPLPRLPKLLGHATPAMTMRDARHAPEAYFAEDAARIGASLSGAVDREAEAVRRAVIHRADTR
jgi:hypothetical protein